MTTRTKPATTLKQLRRNAPRRDRTTPALARHPPLDSERYPSRFARTLPQLRQRCGDNADVAVLDARYSAVSRWLMDWPTPPLPNPRPVTYEALSLCGEEAMYASGLPTPDRGPRPVPTIDRISPESKAEARRVTIETMQAWEAAGQPHLTPDRVTWTHQYILACQRAQTQEDRA